MKVLESKPDKERQKLIRAVASDAANLLGVTNLSCNPKDVMVKIDQTIVDMVFDRPANISDDEEVHLLLGALWGEQLQRQFGWYWANVVLDDEINEVAVISPAQEMIVFPFSFVSACIGKQCVSTLLLSFNMLIENVEFKSLPAGGYENIMLDIHHIVPPYTLEQSG